MDGRPKAKTSRRLARSQPALTPLATQAAGAPVLELSGNVSLNVQFTGAVKGVLADVQLHRHRYRE